MAVTIARVRKLALAMPEVVEEETWDEPTWRVRGKIFVMGGPDTIAVKASRTDQAELIASAPDTYRVAPYVGRYGWVSVTLAHADAGELSELIVEAWRMTAPKRLVKTYDTGTA
jgi:hypothetical protein